MLTLSATHQLRRFSLMTKEEEAEVSVAEEEVAIKEMKKIANKTLVRTEEGTSKGVAEGMTKEEVQAIKEEVQAIKEGVQVIEEAI